MTYKQIYDNVYNILKSDSTTHEDTHYATLKMVDAITFINLTVQQNQEILKTIKESILSNK
jgi:hypothetical protein